MAKGWTSQPNGLLSYDAGQTISAKSSQLARDASSGARRAESEMDHLDHQASAQRRVPIAGVQVRQERGRKCTADRVPRSARFDDLSSDYLCDRIGAVGDAEQR